MQTVVDAGGLDQVAIAEGASYAVVEVLDAPPLAARGLAAHPDAFRLVHHHAGHREGGRGGRATRRREG